MVARTAYGVRRLFYRAGSRRLLAIDDAAELSQVGMRIHHPCIFRGNTPQRLQVHRSIAATQVRGLPCESDGRRIVHCNASRCTTRGTYRGPNRSRPPCTERLGIFRVLSRRRVGDRRPAGRSTENAVAHWTGRNSRASAAARTRRLTDILVVCTASSPSA